MDDLAQANILDHYKHPRNHGTIEQPTVSREEHNPLCGDKVRLDLLGITVGYTRLKCALLGLKALKVGVYTAGGEQWDEDAI